MIVSESPKIELLNCDCMSFMAGVPDKFFDLAIVDPPYGIKEDGRKSIGRVLKKDGSVIYKTDKRNGRQILIAPKTYKGGQYDNEIPSHEYFTELLRVSKDQIIWGENYYPHHFGTGRIFWDKCVSGDFSDGEIAFCSKHNSVRKFIYMWSGFKQGESITNGSKMQGNNNLREKRIHPNHKPKALYRWLLKNYAKEGDKILDTHGGSMSSAIACHRMGFDLTLCELDKDYYEAGVKRFKEQTIQQSLFKQ